jgi:4-amino-4-deoxy-L-arabinose transferase-like glycosyltransferase
MYILTGGCKTGRTMAAIKQRLLEVIQHRHFVLVCVLAGIAARVLWVGLVHPAQVLDFKWYYDRAASIANGDGYAVNRFPTAYWPVGYPGFLGVLFYVFGASVFAGQIANIVLSAATILLVYRLGQQIFHSETAARITVFILCFYPNQIAYNSLLCTEIWFTFLLILGAVLFVAAHGRVGLLVLSGLCWGLATLTKPQFVFLPAIFLLVFHINKKILVKSAVVIYLMIFVSIAPWLVRNQRVMGKPVLSTNGGIVLMQGNNPFATGTYVWNDQIESLLWDQRQGDLGGGANEVARDERARTIGEEYIKRHVKRTLLLWPKKLMYAYRSDVDGFYYSLGMIQAPTNALKFLLVGLRVFAELYYFAILALAAISLKVILGAGTRQFTMGLFVTLYFTGICLVFYGIARYHFPNMPWIAMYAGVGGSLVLGAWRKPSSITSGTHSV